MVKKTPVVLLGSFILLWIILAIKPYYPFDWLLENLLVFIGVPVTVILYKKFALSDLSCFLIFLFLLLHSIGAHYTYSEVPFGYMISDWFGWKRNHYDRIIHFVFGLFLTVPIYEILKKKFNISAAALALFSFTIIVSLGVIYELLEWGVAAIVDPAAGAAYLGSQGDEWDAQKDISLKIVGVLLSFIVFYRHFFHKLQNLVKNK